jgi:hypothetical protein
MKTREFECYISIITASDCRMQISYELDADSKPINVRYGIKSYTGDYQVLKNFEFDNDVNKAIEKDIAKLSEYAINPENISPARNSNDISTDESADNYANDLTNVIMNGIERTVCGHLHNNFNEDFTEYDNIRNTVYQNLIQLINEGKKAYAFCNENN